MKMKKIYLLAASLLCVSTAMAWNGHIHSGITAIADANLTPTAKAEIERVLGNRPVTYYANWVMDVAEEPLHSATHEWHNVALSHKCQILKSKKRVKSKDKDVSTAGAYDGLKQTYAALAARETLEPAKVADNIKYLIHIVADLHCPTHYIFTDQGDAERRPSYDRGKNKHDYYVFWDGPSIRSSHDLSNGEFVHMFNRKSREQVAAIVDGNIEQWIVDNARNYRAFLDKVKPAGTYSNNKYRLWLNKIYPFAEEQATVAGYRMAHLLNTLFDAEYAAANAQTK